MNWRLPGSSIHGVFQARILEWVAISFSRGSSQTKDWTWVSHIVGSCFTIWATREINVPLVSLIFLKRSLDFPILLFSSISLNWLLRKTFLSLLALEVCIQMGISILFSFAFCFSSFHRYCKPSSDSHFAFLHLFFLAMVLISVSCTVSWASIHSSSGTLSIRSNPLNLSLPLYNHKGFDLGHT